MPVATLRDDLRAVLLSFAWDQWSQMGVAAAKPEQLESRAADPEALLIFTLGIARHDPRLFDEVLDWLSDNRKLVSTQRLRNLTAEPLDGRLVGAALRRVGIKWTYTSADLKNQPELLFPELGVPELVDPDFERFSLVRAPAELSGKSSAPGVAPINLAFALRLSVGLGAKAEVVRALLTLDAPRVSGAVLAMNAAYAERNVREALNDLASAGRVRVSVVGGTRYFELEKAAWHGWQTTPPARHFDWIPALSAATEIHRWLSEPERVETAAYLLASDARQLTEAVGRRLRLAGVATSGDTLPGEAYWEGFEATVRALLEAIVRP